MINIDNKDRMLLYELSQDARLSLTQLSKRIQLSKSSVSHRIRRLQQTGIIDRFCTLVNYAAIKANTSILLLRFNQFPAQEISDYFRIEPNTTWAITLSGQWDLLIEIAYNSAEEQEKIIGSILTTFSDKIHSIEMIHHIKALRVEHLIKDFTKGVRPKRQATLKKYKPIEPDKTDYDILRIIAVDSTMNIVDIAHKAGKSIDTVSDRLKRLKESNTLVKCFAEINLQKLGYTEYIYKIKLVNLNKEKVRSLLNELKINEDIKFAGYDMTQTNIIINLAFKDAQDIDIFTSELRRKHSGILASQEYYLIKEQLAFNLFPQGIAHR